MKNTLRESLRVLNNEIDDFIGVRRVRAETETGDTVKCRRGCAACCHMLVTTSLPEVVNALKAAERNGHFTTLSERSPETTDQFNRVLNPELKLADWLDQQHRCLFFSDDGDCMVYEERPQTCRAYLVLSDPEKCSPPTQTILAVDTSGCMEKSFKKLTQMSHAMGLPFLYAPMPFLIPIATVYLGQGRHAALAVMQKLDSDTDDAYRRWAHIAEQERL